MHATIQSETGDDIELTVTGRDGTRHELKLQRNGDLTRHRTQTEAGTFHDQTDDTTERLLQIRRFGKYYLYRQRGYELLTPYAGWERITYPERLAGTALIVGTMSPETFESAFQTIYRQRKRSTDGEPLPVQPPADCQTSACRLIEQDIYLNVDSDVLQALLDVVIELEALGGLRQLMDMYPRKDDTRLLERLAGILDREERPAGEKLGAESFVADTSPLRVYWDTQEGHGSDTETRVERSAGAERQVEQTGTRLDSDASSSDDAQIACRLQLPGTGKPIRSGPAFQRLVFDHLRCQLRDCYVGMGIAPPRDLQVRGPGIAAFSTEYETGSVYQSYHDSKAVIDWNRLPPLPSL